MENTYTPAICGIPAEAPLYRGKITMRMASFEERISFYDDAGVSLDNEGTPAEKSIRNRKLMRHLARKAKDHFVSSTIERVADGYQFDTYEKLNFDSDMVAVLSEMILKLIHKFEVGKDAKPVAGDDEGNGQPPS